MNQKPIKKQDLLNLVAEIQRLNTPIKVVNTAAYQAYCDHTSSTEMPRKFILTNENWDIGIEDEITADPELVLKYLSYSEKLIENLSWLKELIGQIFWTKFNASEVSSPDVLPKAQKAGTSVMQAAEVQGAPSSDSGVFVKPPPQDVPPGSWPVT